MPEKPGPKEMVSRQELLMAQMVQIDTIALLLIEKGVLAQEQSFEKLKQVKVEYERRKRS